MRPSGPSSVLLAFVAMAAALGARAQPNTATARAAIAASVVEGISVQKSQDLVLGEFRPGEMGGTVELKVPASSAVASRSSSGGVALAGSAYSAAEFSIWTHAASPARFYVELPPAITLQRVGGSEIMTLDAFRSSVRQDCAPGAADGCAGGPYTLLVGATLHVQPGQRAGRYVGTFTVTVNQS